MIRLPNIVRSAEEQQNFDYLQSIISQLRFSDEAVLSAVKGVSIHKLAVEDTRGNILGYVQVYPE